MIGETAYTLLSISRFATLLIYNHS